MWFRRTGERPAWPPCDGRSVFTIAMILASVIAISISPGSALARAHSLGRSAAHRHSKHHRHPFKGPGSVDRTFGKAGYFTADVGAASSAAADLIQPDGKVVSAGAGSLPDGTSAMISTRTLPNGRPDKAYGNNGLAVISVGAQATATSLALQADGKIVLAGNGTAQVERLDTFPQPSHQNCAPGFVPILNPFPPPTFLYFCPYFASEQTFAVVRLLANGTPDHSFGKNGVVTVPISQPGSSPPASQCETTVVTQTNACGPGFANAVVVQANGGILVAGDAISPSSNKSEAVVARLSSSGSVDSSFASGGVANLAANSEVNGMALQHDGKIVLAGSRAGGYLAMRVNASGTLDGGFGSGGMASVPVGTGGAANAIAIQPDNKLVLAGSSSSGAGAVRLLSSGALDGAFATNGISSLGGTGANAVALSVNGKIALGGRAGRAVRLLSNGRLDRTFGGKHGRGRVVVKIGAAGDIGGLAVQPDGKLVLAGTIARGGDADLLIARLRG